MNISIKKFLFSLAVIGAWLAIPSFAFAQSAVLYFIPSGGTFAQGTTFRVTVMADTKAEQVNAVAAYFTYPVDKLEAVGVDTAGSIMSFIAEKQAAGGRADISGGSPTPGFSGVQKIASVDFLVKPGTTGNAELAFASDAAVLRDSDNQNILNLGSSLGATFQLATASAAPPPPTPPPAPTPTPSPTPPASKPPAAPPSAPSFELSISNIEVTRTQDNKIRISWHTNRAADSRVNYGAKDESPFCFSVLDGEFAERHSIALSGVQEYAGYAFEIIGRDRQGARAQTERLLLGDFEKPAEQPSEEKPEIAADTGFELPFPRSILLAGLGVAALLVFGFVVLARRRRG